MSSKNEASLRSLWQAGIIYLLLGTAAGDAALISTFQAGNSSWHLGTLAVGQLDGSRDLGIVLPYRDSSTSWFLDAFKFTGQRLPGFPARTAAHCLQKCVQGFIAWFRSDPPCLTDCACNVFKLACHSSRGNLVAANRRGP